MLEQIKELAEPAIKLQKKDNMDMTLRRIIEMCEPHEEIVKRNPEADALVTAAVKSAKGGKK